MNNILSVLFFVSVIFVISCQDEPSRTYFSHSSPVIENVTVSPKVIVYGDSVIFECKVSDELTPLSTLELKMIANDVIVARRIIRTEGQTKNIFTKIGIEYNKELPDGEDIELQLKLTNVEGDETVHHLKGLKGQRRYFKLLYLVLDNGDVYPMYPRIEKSDSYITGELIHPSNSVRYFVAEKLTAGNRIDFSGYVWGYYGRSINTVDSDGGYITTSDSDVDYVNQIEFDTYHFKTKLYGSKYDRNDILLSFFEEVTLDNEIFLRMSRELTFNDVLTLHGELASNDIVFNPDYFERIAPDKVKFRGKTEVYDIYYSRTRQFVLVDPASRSFPDVLLIAGEGLGYPSKTQPKSHTKWGFTAPLQTIIFRQIEDGVYQGTVYFDSGLANFKPFENQDWGNEKISTEFSMPSLIARDSDLGKTDGNWYAAPNARSGIYRITIDLSSKSVTATPFRLY